MTVITNNKNQTVNRRNNFFQKLSCSDYAESD